MTSTITPHREPLGATLARTLAIALAVGGVLALRSGRLQLWPVAAVLFLWFSVGGHWVELWFLNWLRPRLSRSRAAQLAARLVVWFVGGVVLGFAMALTTRLFAMTRDMRLPPWWTAGVAFVGLELIVHAVLLLRHRPNFYNGEG